MWCCILLLYILLWTVTTFTDVTVTLATGVTVRRGGRASSVLTEPPPATVRWPTCVPLVLCVRPGSRAATNVVVLSAKLAPTAIRVSICLFYHHRPRIALIIIWCFSLKAATIIYSYKCHVTCTIGLFILFCFLFSPENGSTKLWTTGVNKVLVLVLLTPRSHWEVSSDLPQGVPAQNHCESDLFRIS